MPQNNIIIQISLISPDDQTANNSINKQTKKGFIAKNNINVEI